MPLNISHRGHIHTAENTLESFHESIEQGAQMLELDVRLSKDGVPMVAHDNTLNRRAGKRGSVSTRTSRFLMSLDVGSGYKMPSLRTALEQILPRVPVNIELKFNNLNYRPLVGAVVQLIEDMKGQSKVLVSSFFHQSLEILNKQAPKIATAPLFGSNTGPPHPDDVERLASLGKWHNKLPFRRPAAVVDNKMIDEELARIFRDNKLTLLTYTVDDPDEMRRLIKLGVAGIITNRPNVLNTLLEEYGRKNLGQGEQV